MIVLDKSNGSVLSTITTSGMNVQAIAYIDSATFATGTSNGTIQFWNSQYLPQNSISVGVEIKEMVLISVDVLVDCSN